MESDEQSFKSQRKQLFEATNGYVSLELKQLNHTRIAHRVHMINLSQSLKRFIPAYSLLMRIVWFYANLAFLGSFIIPKNNHLWIFGAWLGENYSDNSKYLFEYVNNNHPKIRAVWLTKNSATRDLVRSHGHEAHLARSLHGLSLRIRSGVWIVCVSISDIHNYSWRIGRVKVVQLWHGTPLKKIGPGPSRVRRRFFPRYQVGPLTARIRYDDLYIATSYEVRSKIAHVFKVAPDLVKITGYPRTDVFFDEHRERTPITEVLQNLKGSFLLGVYMPTVRQDGKTSISFLMQDLNAVNAKLVELRVILLIKLHFFHLTELESLDGKFDNIWFIRDEDINGDIYPILSETDFLITDYSSVYFDYLLMNKPIIFAPFDIESYTETDRALYYNYQDVTPGPKAHNWEEVIACIKEISRYRKELMGRGDPYECERKRVNHLFNAYSDGNNNKRVYEAIMEQLNNK